MSSAHALPASATTTPETSRASALLPRFAWIVLAYNVAVVLWGAVVRATSSGAGCGDHWPLCNGVVVQTHPRLATLIELAHRMTSGITVIAILLLLVLRIGVRLKRGSPPLPDDMPAPQRVVAKLSHLVLYALMLAMPLIGWSMLSAEGYPVTLFGAVHLPAVMPHDVRLFAALRALHTYLALALFLTVLGHLAAALFHGLIRRDGVFSSMARGARRA